MRTLKLGAFGRAHVWLDQLPTFAHHISKMISYEIVANSSESVRGSTVVIEAFVPVGGMAYYGLLGFEYIPQDIKKLLVSISCGESGQRLHREIAGSVEEVFLGLPEAYVQSVIDQVRESSRKLSSGVLKCHYSTYGVYGSSSFFFGKLTKACLTIMSLDEELSGEQPLSLILDDLIKNI